MCEVLKLGDELTSSGGHERTTGYEQETDEQPPLPPPDPHNHHHPLDTDKATGLRHSWSTAVCACVNVSVCSYLTVRVFLVKQGDVAVGPGVHKGRPVPPPT